MKKLFFVTVFVLLLAFVAFGQKAGGAKADPAKGVREAFDRLVDGIKQVDADKVMSVYDNSPRLLIFNNNGTATLGWENVKANVMALYPKTSNVTLDITGLRVEMTGANAAYVTCKWKQSQEFAGKLESASGRMTMMFKLVGKNWKITHRHTSPDKPDPSLLLPSERTPEKPEKP
jgi:ketosteroid isomerase-like protein